MTDFVQLQKDVENVLLCCDLLRTINVVQYRKLRVQSEIDWSALWMTARGPEGRKGLGILVEMPTFTVNHPNLPGPDTLLTISCAIVEEPNINFEPTTGCQMSAEEGAQIVLEELHELLIEGQGGFFASAKAIEDAPEFQGLVAYRASLTMRNPRQPRVRVAIPTIVEAGLNVTLTCATAGAAIYYTTDGSWPGPSNDQATVYAGPFDLEAETLVALRWAAFKDGMRQSNVGRAEN